MRTGTRALEHEASICLLSMCCRHVGQWLSKCALRNPGSTSQAAQVLLSPVLHVGDSGRFYLRKDSCFLLKALKTTGESYTWFYATATHVGPGQEEFRLRGGLRAFVPAGSLFPRTGFSLEGALPWPGLQGSRLCVCLLCCGGRKGVANKPSVHMGPSKHSSQNSGVGWTLRCRNL